MGEHCHQAVGVRVPQRHTAWHSTGNQAAIAAEGHRAHGLICIPWPELMITPTLLALYRLLRYDLEQGYSRSQLLSIGW